jgi:lysophospholipase L1-like esterase
MMTTHLSKSVVTLVISLLAAVPAAPQSPAPRVRIVLVGDSTTAVRSGWGPGFCADVVEQVACVNMAKGGRSSSSYRAEGSWANVMDELKRNADFQSTYVLIQFGHNDQPLKPGRSTDLVKEFPANMRRYAEEVKAVGAKPVLITPLARRFVRDGRLTNDLGPWAAVTRAVAAELGVPLLDLNADSVEALEKMGAVEANTLAMAPPSPAAIQQAAFGESVALPKPPPKAHAGKAPEPPAEAAPVFDYTHLGAKGSAYFGRIVADELAKAVPDLQPYIKP